MTEAELSNLVFNQYTTQDPTANKVLPVHHDMEIKLRNGKSDAIALRYHGTPAESLYVNSPRAIEQMYKHILNYFNDRGFITIEHDIAKRFKQAFIYIGSGILMTMAFKWQKNRQQPVALDFLVSTAGLISMIETYQPDSRKRMNGKLYPVRIPITTNYCDFNRRLLEGPIVYYDLVAQAITIHIEEAHILQGEELDYIPSDPNLNLETSESIVSFHGTFSLLKQEGDRLVKAKSSEDVDYLVQSTSEVKIINSYTFFDETNRQENRIPLFEGEVFTPMIMAPISGGSTSIDIYAIPGPEFNSYVIPTAPMAFTKNRQVSHHGSSRSRHRGNHHSFGLPSTITLFDLPNWNVLIYRLPREILLGSLTAEEVDLAPRLEDVSNEIAMANIALHETAHICQLSTGISSFMPIEGMAVAFEMDPVGSQDTIDVVFRCSSTFHFVTATGRGDVGVMYSDGMADAELCRPTYGTGFFWNWVRERYDTEHKIIKRLGEILAKETLGSMLENNNLPTIVSPGLIRSSVGGLLALDQAIKELRIDRDHAEDLAAVFTAFAISMAYVRNNKSIPVAYRHDWPHFVYDDHYRDWAKILHSTETTFPSLVPYATWWQMLQNNDVIPSEMTSSSYGGERITRILPDNVVLSAGNMKSFLFTLPVGTSSLVLDDVDGEWRIAVVKFVSDGTRQGSWFQWPAINQTFTIRNGQSLSIVLSGNLIPTDLELGRSVLVCVNVGLFNPGPFAGYYYVELPTASLTIRRNES